MRAADAVDDIEALRDHCQRFIDTLPRSQGRAMALAKLGEMIFWLRAHHAQQRRVMGDGA